MQLLKAILPWTIPIPIPTPLPTPTPPSFSLPSSSPQQTPSKPNPPTPRTTTQDKATITIQDDEKHPLTTQEQKKRRRRKAQAAYATLQTWYNSSTGVWVPSTGWWNSANCLTVITNLAEIDASVKKSVSGVLANTYVQAQQYNLGMRKDAGIGSVSRPYLQVSYYTHEGGPRMMELGEVRMQVTSGFLNDYYDDEGWWALAWIAAYDLTGKIKYLSQAESIFADMRAVFGKTNCSTNSGGIGGIWWDKPNTYVNAIANELFLSVAASLANRVRTGSVTYLSIAEQQYSWFMGSGMLIANDTINDGLDQQTCKNNNGTVWSYNQGVILGGLVELSKAARNATYLSTAHKIADAAIATLAPGGILTEACEPDCGADGAQFKGVFVRNLQILHKASPQARYAIFLDNNAESIWSRNRNSRDELSVKWSGPFVAPANASTQSSAMDCLVASLAT